MLTFEHRIERAIRGVTKSRSRYGIVYITFRLHVDAQAVHRKCNDFFNLSSDQRKRQSTKTSLNAGTRA